MWPIFTIENSKANLDVYPLTSNGSRFNFFKYKITKTVFFKPNNLPKKPVHEICFIEYFLIDTELIIDVL